MATAHLISQPMERAVQIIAGHARDRASFELVGGKEIDERDQSVPQAIDASPRAARVVIGVQ